MQNRDLLKGGMIVMLEKLKCWFQEEDKEVIHDDDLEYIEDIGDKIFDFISSFNHELIYFFQGESKKIDQC